MPLRTFTLLCATLGATASALAQPPIANLPKWNAVSVRPERPNECINWGMVMRRTTADLEIICTPLLDVIGRAYLIREKSRIFGAPGWATSSTYEIDGNVSGENAAAYSKLSADDKRSMLQQLLENCFHLKVHAERRELPIFELAIARGGPKLKEPTGTEENKPGWLFGIPGENFRAVDLPLTELTWMLNTKGLGRTVVDKTGLTGKYDFALQYLPAEKAATDTSSGPTIFTALEEQLGLKLEPAKAMMDVLVIDSIEQPRAN